jgi:hypothetical protein
MCRHECIKTENCSCSKCGCHYDSKSGVFGLKSEKYRDPHVINGKIFLNFLNNLASNFQQMEHFKINPVVNQILEQLII